MNLHKKIIAEDAAGGAVGGGAIAVLATPLMASCARRSMPEPKIIKYGNKKKLKAQDIYKTLNIKEGFSALLEFDPTNNSFPGADASSMGGPMQSKTGNSGRGNADTSEVIAKLKGLENKEKVDRHDTAIFGLQDDHGKIIRITVRSDQAAAFEQALQGFLSDHERDAGEGKAPEVAEIIFKLKDRFDIVDVDFPDVEEDEEEDMQLADQQQDGEQPMDGEQMPMDNMGDDAGLDDTKSLLTQVIDMMKADADARKADAHARAAEAKAREAEVGKKTAYAKVKHEEEILDMESQEKARKAEEKEAKQLAKLSKWKHQMRDEEGASFDEEEEETDHIEDMITHAASKPVVPITPPQEDEEAVGGGDIAAVPAPIGRKAQPASKISGRVSASDVASFILSRV